MKMRGGVIMSMKKNISNIDGTTKPAFKIGARGISLVPEAVQDEESLRRVLKLFLKDDNGNIEELLSSGNIEIPKRVCSKIETKEDKTIFTFETFDIESRKWIKEEISIDNYIEQKNSITGPETSVKGNLVSFADDTGKKIEDSNISVSGKIDTKESNNDSKVPTVDAIIGYVGDITDILNQRIKGNI